MREGRMGEGREAGEQRKMYSAIKQLKIVNRKKRITSEESVGMPVPGYVD